MRASLMRLIGGKVQAIQLQRGEHLLPTLRKGAKDRAPDRFRQTESGTGLPRLRQGCQLFIGVFFKGGEDDVFREEFGKDVGG